MPGDINYNDVSITSGSITVSQKAITITPNAGQSKKYGATNPTYSYTPIPALVGADSFTGGISRTAGEDVETYTYTLGSLSAGANYTLTLGGINTFEIKQATVTAVNTTIGTVTKTAFEAKDADTTAKIATLAGLPASVNVTTDGGNTTLPIVWTTSDTYDAKDKAYSFTGTLTGNENIANGGKTATATVTITPVTATNPTFEDTLAVKNTEPAATASDLGISILPTSGNIVVQGVNVAYTINWNGGQTLDRTTIGNEQTFTGTVSYTSPPAWLTISGANTVSRKVTVTDKILVTITGITANSNLTYDKTAKEVNKTLASAGLAAITGLSYQYEGENGTAYVASATAPTNAGDYKCTVTLTDVTHYAQPIEILFTITPKQLTAWDGTSVSVTSKSYDGNTTATVTGTLAVQGVISGDTVNVTGGSMTAVYDNASSGSGKTVTVTPVGYSTTNTNYLLPTAGTTFTKTGTINGLTFAGSVTISNTSPKVGDVLTANVTETSAAGSYTYSWNGTGANKTGSTYTVVAADVGNTLTVTVGTSNPEYMGNFSSAATSAAASAGGSGNNGSGGGSTTPTVDTTSAISGINNAPTGGTVTVAMNGVASAPASILEAAKGKDVNVVFNYGSYSWTINGKSIGTIPAGRITYDLSVKSINSSVISALDGNSGVLQLDITHSGALPFTATLTYDVGTAHNGKTLYLYYYNPTSKRLEYQASGTVSGGKIKLDFTHASQYLLTDKRIDKVDNPNTGGLNPFTDVSENDWFFNAVMIAYDQGLFAGTSETKFSPNAPMTRAMFATVLARLDGVDLSGYTVSNFSDVAIGTWYGPAVAWAADKGITGGVGGGKFAPDKSITREEMAVMLYKYMAYEGITPPAADSNEPFSDSASFSPWAVDAIADMRRLGLISGVGGDRYNPQGTATRAEVAQIFLNYLNAAAEPSTK